VVTLGAIGTLAVLARVEVDWLLEIERLPEKLPTADGAKVIVKVVLCPPANVNGSGGPLIVKPPPDAAIWMSVMAAVPEFVRVRLWLILELIATFPKLRLVGVTTRVPDVKPHPDWLRAANNTVGKSKKIIR
jgi:hypothetical protein